MYWDSVRRAIKMKCGLLNFPGDSPKPLQDDDQQHRNLLLVNCLAALTPFPRKSPRLPFLSYQ